MKSQKQAVVLIAFLFILGLSTSYAAVPSTISFQARVTDSTGNPINDTVDITIKLYDDPFTPTEKWSEVHPAIPLVDIEIVELKLSSITPFPVDIWDNNELWMGITVNTDPEMTPRIRILSVPYALRTEGVDGHIFTAPSSIYIPDLTLTDTLISFTPGSVTFEGVPVDFSGTEAQFLSAGHDYVRIDATGLLLRTPPTPKPVPLPAPMVPGDLSMLIADDAFNQMFASLCQAGRLQTYAEPTASLSDLLPEHCSFYTNDGATLSCRIGSAGMELHGGSVQLLDGANLVVTGTLDLTGGTLDLSGSSLTVGGDLDVGGSLTVDGGGIFTDGAGTLTFSGSGGWQTRVDSGGLKTDFGSVTVSSSGTVTLSTEVRAADLRLTVDATDLVTLSYDSGGTGGGRIDLSDGGTSSLALDGVSLAFSDGTSSATIRRIGDVLAIDPPPIALGGLELGGFVTFTDPKLMTLETGSELRFESGSLSDYLGVTGDIRVEGSGLRIRESALLCEPLGGGAGGRISIDYDELRLTDDVASHTVLFHRSNGLSLSSASSGTLTIYRHDGVQLTGPDLHKLDISRSGYTLTRPSNNWALVCDLDDAADVFYCDLDDDGLRDIRFQHTPSNELVLESGTSLRCEGPTSMTSCDVSGLATLADCDISGTTHCRDTWSCDVDDDATNDVYCDDLGPGPRLVVASGTELRCSGPAFCDASLDVGGTTTCRSVWTCDVDDDATQDVWCDDLGPGPRLVVASGSALRCEGSALFASSCELDGSLTCRSSVVLDVNGDATTDVSLAMSPGPELLVSTGTRFACDGLSTFAQPVQVNSDMTVTGQLQVLGPKFFVQQHPEDASKEIYYVALEGNEAGTYTRGSSQLKEGVAEINLPEDFHLVTNEEGLTAQITPRGPVQSMLYVESITPTKLIVRASNDKDSNVKFDFMVNGVRQGFENIQIIRDKKSYASNR